MEEGTKSLWKTKTFDAHFDTKRMMNSVSTFLEWKNFEQTSTPGLVTRLVLIESMLKFTVVVDHTESKLKLLGTANNLLTEVELSIVANEWQ